MVDAETLRHIKHSRAPLSAWFGIVLLFALFGMIVLAIIGPSPRGSDYEESRAKKRIENLKALRQEADKALTTYGWIDKNKGVARIPIERAMELTVAELAKQKPAPAGPIATPAPAAANAGKPQPTAGAPASPAPASPAPAASPQAGGASPSAQNPASPSPAAQSSPTSPVSPSPTKSP